MPSELRMFIPVAIRALMERLLPRMEAAAGTSLAQITDLNPAIPERISAGEAFDIGLTNPPYVKMLVAAGYADGASHHAFGRVPLAVGRKAGSEKSVRTGAQEVVALFRGVESIGYTGAGTSGQIYLDLLAQFGLRDEFMAKSRAMGSGEPVASVVAGETELAVAPLTTILSTPGVMPAAIFPEELGAHIDMSVFLSRTSHARAKSVLEFLTAVELDAELAAAGVMRFELI